MLLFFTKNNPNFSLYCLSARKQEETVAHLLHGTSRKVMQMKYL